MDGHSNKFCGQLGSQLMSDPSFEFIQIESDDVAIFQDPKLQGMLTNSFVV